MDSLEVASVADTRCSPRIRNFPSRIPGQRGTGSRILNKEFKYFKPKIVTKLKEKYDPECFFRIPDLDFFLSRIPESKEQRISDPDHPTLEVSQQACAGDIP